MRRLFVLDETLVKAAVDCDPISTAILRGVCLDRDAVLVWNAEWHKRCVRNLLVAVRTSKTAQLNRYMPFNQTTSGKLLGGTNDPEPLPDEGGIPEQARWAVRLAVAMEAILVTADLDLIRLLTTRGIRAVSPEELKLQLIGTR